ncbi:MAG: ABC transporter permease [Butyrivibrio sp.]|nr:ABC transporter permease [Butyrivibrio sp.]
MAQILEYIASAIKNINHNRFRSLLTMLGIIIGIASVITVITLGDGMAGYVKGELNALAGNYATLRLDESKTSETLTLDDMRALEEEIPELYGTSVTMYGSGTVSARRATVDAQVTGCTQYYIYEYGNRIINGRYLSERDVDDGAAVCVLLESDAKQLFGTTDVVGMTLDLSMYGITRELTIVGVREDFGGMVSMMLSVALEDYLAMPEVPYTFLIDQYYYSDTDFTSIDLFAAQEDLPEAGKKAVALMEIRHGLRGEQALSIASMQDSMGQIDEVMNNITLFMSLVAAISRLVGGIGVMNIMLVSVTERTREIGIRKSIGARTSSVMVQFLAESAILSALGGILGILLGIGLASVLCRALGFTTVVRPTVVIGATLFSAGVGIFFGLYPARKAAKMRPIDALRL